MWTRNADVHYLRTFTRLFKLQAFRSQCTKLQALWLQSNRFERYALCIQINCVSCVNLLDFCKALVFILSQMHFTNTMCSSSFKSNIWKDVCSVCSHVCAVDTTVALAFSGVWIVPLHIFLMNIFNPSRVQENPYVMRKDNYQDFQGNDQYEGFCVDMLREVADILKFSFKIKLVDDGLYGAPEPNGSWTGMVGELINRVSTIPQPLSVSQQTLRGKKWSAQREIHS